MLDQSFKTLVYSLIVHGVLAWLLLHSPSQFEIRGAETPVEFTVREEGKRQTFVAETAQKDDLLEDLKRKADYLSQFTKRVKEEVRARETGQTKNRTGNYPLETEELGQRGQMGSSRDRSNERELQLPPGLGPRQGQDSGANTFGRNVVVGASTSGEYIPGVKVGNFTALNTDRFTYYTFFNRINEQVRSRWVRNLRQVSASNSETDNLALAARERITEVDIQLDRAGGFVRAVVLRSSGYPNLDQAATLAFKDAAPFANPPQSMIESDGLIHLRYGFVVQWSASAPMGR